MEEYEKEEEFSKAFLHLYLVKLDFKNSKKAEIKLLGENIETVLNLLIEYSQIIKNSITKEELSEHICNLKYLAFDTPEDYEYAKTYFEKLL